MNTTSEVMGIFSPRLSFGKVDSKKGAPCETFHGWCILRGVNRSTMERRVRNGHFLPLPKFSGFKSNKVCNYYVITDLDTWFKSWVQPAEQEMIG